MTEPFDPADAHKRIKITAIVHVIEARHLVGKDSNHLSDPFVRVTVAGKRQSTAIRRNQINATWNQVFMFEDLDLSMEEYESELIMLQVYDANVFFRNELIGQFSFSLSKVRNQPPPSRHQVYRKWLVLTNPEAPLEEQGYLLASVTVLGPGDVPPSHERQDDYYISSRDNQQIREDKIIRNPSVSRRGYNFSVKVFRGEHLPITDTWNKTCDPFVVVRFNGIVARTPHQAHTVTPNWNHLLVLPVFTPCFSDTIEIQLYDYVRGSPDRLLATCRLKFTSLLGESFPPTWFNFYGRVDEENVNSGWICDVVRATNSDIDSTAYMGRILMSLNTTLTDSPQHADRPCAPIKGPKTEKYILWVDIYRGSELPTTFLSGSVMVEVQFGPSDNTRRSDFCDSSTKVFDEADEADVFMNQPNSISFSASEDNLAPESRLISDENGFVKGPCQFKEIQVALPQISHTGNPHAASQLYDIIINVYIKGLVGAPTRVGYIRMKPTDVWGYNNAPEWHSIKGLVNRKGQSTTPGQLLVGASFGTVDDVRKNNIVRKPMMTMAGRTYQLRAHIYQARNLSPTTEEGMANASVRVSLGGKTARLELTSRYDRLKELVKTKTTILEQKGVAVQSEPGMSRLQLQERVNQLWEEHATPDLYESSTVTNSLSPVWFETLVIDQVQLPQPLSLAPDIEIRVRDKNLADDDYIGRVKFPVSLCTLDMWPFSKKPRWLRMAKLDLTQLRKPTKPEGPRSILQLRKNAKEAVNNIEAINYTGEILVKLELIPIEKVRKYPLWSHRWPRVIPSSIYLGSVGIRQIQEFGIFEGGKVENPHVEITVQSTPNMNGPVSVASHTALEKQVVVLRDDDSTDFFLGDRRATKSGVVVKPAKGARGSRNQKEEAESVGEDPSTSSESTSNNSEDALTSAKQHKWMYLVPPFFDSMDSKGNLPDEWLAAGDYIEDNAFYSVIRHYSDDKSRMPNLFHPPSVDETGVATWSNNLPPQEGDVTSSSPTTQPTKSSNQEEAQEEEEEEFDKLSMRDVEDLEQGKGAKNQVRPLAVTNQLVEKERGRRTFFSKKILYINMPLDPFYCPSLTIKLFDTRGGIFGTKDTLIACATVSLQDFTEFLYTDAMKRRAVLESKVYEIPRFAMSPETREELQRQGEKEPDAGEEDWWEEATTSSSGSTSGSERNPAESDTDGLETDSLPGTRKGEDSSPSNKKKKDAGNAAESEQDIYFEKLFEEPAEGHFELPTTITCDVEEINNTYEDDLETGILSASVKAGGAEDEGAKDTGGFLWPTEDSQTREALSRTSLLEESEHMKPLPFFSFPLYRGKASDGPRVFACVFKTSILIRPRDTILDALQRVAKSFAPPKDRSGQVLLTKTVEGTTYDFIAVGEDDFVRVVPNAPDVGSEVALIEKIKYRPAREPETFGRGLCPVNVLFPLMDPFSTLDVSPDVLLASEDTEPQLQPISSTILHEQHVKVRVYIVACSQLSARSFFQNTSDPYLVVKLNVPHYLKDNYRGTTFHNDRANYKPNTLDPFFGTWFELDAMFPDITELQVEVWNANYVSDDLIGMTRIDLEDRWFNQQWHDLKFQRKKIKEFRPLTAPGSELSQGVVEMWVEIFRPEDAVNAPIVDIRAPKTSEWELRLVCWETRRVPLFDDHNYANLYLTGELYFEGLDGTVHDWESHETDSHTGLKDGRGIFNYRMKFQLESPCKFPRLKLKVWERWLFSHTALGEATIDLSPLVRQAARSQDDVIDRPRRWVELTHANWPGQHRGDLDIQMSLVTKRYAEANPVGNARDPPNENPFLPDPPRESFFAQVFRSAGAGRMICCTVVCIAILVVILVIVFLK